MTKRVHLPRMIFPVMLLLACAGGTAAAETGSPEPGLEQEPRGFLEESAVRPEEERHVETLEQKGGFVGYSFIGSEGYGGRAFEYGFLRSSRSGGLFYNKLEKESNFDLGGAFLNEHDYHGDLALDYRGDYRLHLRTESLFHNTDREILFSPDFTAPRTDAPTPAQYRAAQEPRIDYGVSIVQDSADFRYRLHNYPLHVNLGYWRYVKEGTIQQRFADASFEGSPNTIFAVPRRIEHQTQEGRVGLDAHLGPVDLIYDFRYRAFEDREPTPVADFVPRNDIHGNPERAGGLHQHNEYPESRFASHTVKLHSSLAGGLVAGGSYSVEQRENLSRLTDTSGVKHLSVTLHNAAGDFVYTRSRNYSVAVKYRRQELDNDNRGLLFSNNFVNPVQLAKPPVDSVRDRVMATLTWKPRRDLSIAGEYRGDFLRRDHVSPLPTPVTWNLPQNTDSHTGSLSVHYRPITGTRIDGNYNYVVTDHPSYGSSFHEKHEGKLMATCIRNNSWGGTANAVVRREYNDEVEHFLIRYPLDPLAYTPYPLMSRERTTKNVNLGAWIVPVEKLTLGASYAYVQTRVDQGVLFTSVAFGSQAASDFVSRSHVYGVNASYAAGENLDLSLMLQQVRLLSVFEPQLVAFSAYSDTSGIRDITRQHTVIGFLSARGEYRFTPAVSGSLEYTVRDYNEKNEAYSAYNGTVHAVLATVAAKW